MKKGSLNLSINAIVVLILAVTLLSLGLTFINNTFGGATNQLQQSLEGIDENRRNQLMSQCSDDACIEQSSIELSRNEQDTNLFVLNNKLDCDVDVAITIDENCQIIGEEGTCEDIQLSTFTEQMVPAKQKVIVPISISPRNSAVSTTYRYKIEADGSGSSAGCRDSKLYRQLWLDVEIG